MFLLEPNEGYFHLNSKPACTFKEPYNKSDIKKKCLVHPYFFWHMSLYFIIMATEFKTKFCFRAQLVESRLSHKVHDSSRHSVDLNFDDHEPQRPSRFDADPKEIYHGVDFETFSQVRDGLYFEDDISSTDSADVIAQAKYRLKSLDQEAHVSLSIFCL